MLSDSDSLEQGEEIIDILDDDDVSDDYLIYKNDGEDEDDDFVIEESRDRQHCRDEFKSQFTECFIDKNFKSFDDVHTAVATLSKNFIKVILQT